MNNSSRWLCLVFLLALAGCNKKPPPEVCSDHRVMTVVVLAGLGWTDPKILRVCVIREEKVEPPR